MKNITVNGVRQEGFQNGPGCVKFTLRAGVVLGRKFRVNIDDRIGAIPVVSSLPLLVSAGDTFAFDKQVFLENPRWSHFLRRGIAADKQGEGDIPEGYELFVLVNNTSARWRLKALFTRAAGKPFDKSDEATCLAGQQMIAGFAHSYIGGQND